MYLQACISFGLRRFLPDDDSYKVKEISFPSMSQIGNYHDNSVMENFYRIMKQEMYSGLIYITISNLQKLQTTT